MITEAHVSLLRGTDERIKTDEESLKILQQTTDQLIEYCGGNWVGEYLTAIIPKAIPDAIVLGKPAVQVLSTFQAMFMMGQSIGLKPSGIKFAEAMDVIISNSEHKTTAAPE